MTGFALVAAHTRSSAELHAAFTAAFSDYIAGPFQMPLDQWPSLLARHGIDLARSRVALRGDELLAFAFTCPRPAVGRWRLGVMGALPAARGTGAAPALLDDFLARAADEGVAATELECFAGNERALRLYRSRGFEVMSPLSGWRSPGAPAPASPPARDVRVLAREAAFAWLDAADLRIDLLPFPNTHQCQAAQVRPLTFWLHGGALLAFSVVEGTPTQVHLLIDPDPTLRDAEVLARAIRAAHPDAFAHPVLRDDLGGDALRRAGFEPVALNQVLMRRA